MLEVASPGYEELLLVCVGEGADQCRAQGGHGRLLGFNTASTSFFNTASAQF